MRPWPLPCKILRVADKAKNGYLMMSPPPLQPHVLLIGCGNMGTALLRGWGTDQGMRLSVIDPRPLPADLSPFVSWSGTTFTDLPQNARFDMIVLAVKPQQIDSVLDDLSQALSPTTAVLSIAAGRTISGIARHFPAGQVIIRAMPNLPAAIGQGITAAFTPKNSSPTQKELAGRLLAAAGTVVWVDTEEMIDAVTALSGSGPAYLFLLVDVLAQAGVMLGLSPDLAMRLARTMVTGSAALLAERPELSARDLRDQVTSPGGTTSAALDVLLGSNENTAPLQTLFNTALSAAKRRAEELKQ